MQNEVFKRGRFAITRLEGAVDVCDLHALIGRQE